MQQTQSRATFSRMQDSTVEDWQAISEEFKKYSAGLTDRVIAHLKLLEGDYGGFAIDRMQHSLQTATLALKDGRDDEYVTCALLHDIGDTLGSFNHPDIAAAILKPFVSEKNHWMVEKHGIFQGYYFFHHLGMDREIREQFRTHPYFDYTHEFCDLYDAPAFNEKRESLPISEFEPIVRRVLAKPVNTIYRKAK